MPFDNRIASPHEKTTYKPLIDPRSTNMKQNRADLLQRLGSNRGGTFFVGAGEWGPTVKTLLHPDTEGELTHFTTYGAPASEITNYLSRSVDENTNILVNAEHNPYRIKYDPSNRHRPKTAGARAFGRFMGRRGANVTETRFQMHAKTFIKYIDGQETLFIGTGNFTRGALDSHKLANELGRMAETFDPAQLQQKASLRAKGAGVGRAIARNMGHMRDASINLAQEVGEEIVPTFSEDIKLQASRLARADHHEAMIQVNFGVVTQDQKYISEYKAIFQDLAADDHLDGDYDNFIIGGPGGNSREKYIDLIQGAQEQITLVSPYVDDMSIADALAKKASHWAQDGDDTTDVTIVTLPFASQFKKGTGGSVKGRLNFVTKMYRAKAKIYMADASSRVMIHGKAITIDKAMAIVGSHNKTNKAAERSIEANIILGETSKTIAGDMTADELADMKVGEETVKAINEQLDTLKAAGAIRLVTSEDKGEWSLKKLRNQIAGAGLAELGMHNEQFAHAIADEHSGFTLSASAGASYHFGRAIHATLMNQAGYFRLGETRPAMGAAESTMRAVSMLNYHREPSTWELMAARNFDTGTNTPGLGQWLNQKIFLPMGWGRVYKDEKGALPSIMGLAGRILDEGYLYYAQALPDYIMLGQDYGQGVGFGSYEGEVGIFEKLLSGASQYALASAQALGLYMAVSQPIEMLKASMNKNFIEGQMRSFFRFRPEADNVSAVGKMQASAHITVKRYRGLKKAAFAAGGSPFPYKSVKVANIMAGVNIPDMVATSFDNALAFHYFGSMAKNYREPGGLAAAIMEHRYDLNVSNLKGHQRHFYNSDWSNETARKLGIRSLYTELNHVQRVRGKKILEKVFQPFLEDFVNPYDVSVGATWENPIDGKMTNPFHEYNRRVKQLVDEVGKPPDLEIKVKAGESLQFEVYRVKGYKEGDHAATITSRAVRNKLYRQMTATGAITAPMGPASDVVVHTIDTKLLSDELIDTVAHKDIRTFDAFMKHHNDEMSKITKAVEELDAKQLNLQEALNKARKSQSYGARRAINKYADELKQIEVQRVLLDFKKNSYRSQLGRVADKMDFSLTHVGTGYKTNIAKHVQNVLDMTPINPFKWGAVSRSLVGTSDTVMIGQLFSFHRSAQLIEDAITGDNAIKRVLYAASQIALDDTAVIAANQAKVMQLQKVAAMEWGATPESLEELQKVQKQIDDLEEHSARLKRTSGDIGSVFRQKLQTFDNIVEGTFERLNQSWRKAQTFSKEVRRVSRQFRQFEDTVVGTTSTPNELKGKIGYTSDPSSELQKGARVVDDLGEGRVVIEAKGKNASQSMDELIEAANSYDDMMRTSTNIGQELSDDLVARAVAQNKSMNIADNVVQVKRGAAKNLIIEGKIQSLHWAGAAILFSAIALNNIAQSTSGASLLDQFALTIAGSDYKLAVEARGNKILPLSEVMAHMTGMDPTIAHTVVEGGTIAAALYAGRKIAISQSAMGFVPYTLTQKHVKAMVDEGTHALFKQVNGAMVRIEGATGQQVMDAIFNATKDKGFQHGSEFYIRSLNKNVDKHLKVTALSSGAFETKPFLQMVMTEVPTKTFVYGTMALLALGAVRNVAAGFLNNMTDGEGAKEGWAYMGGMIATFGTLGLAADMAASKGVLGNMMSMPKTAHKVIETGATLGARVARLGTANLLQGRVGVGVGLGIMIGGALGLTRLAKVGAFKEETPGGALDPLAGALIGGTLGAMALRSPAGMLISATAGLLLASTMNWAGIKFIRTSQRGQVHDQDNLRMVSQLGLFSSSVLQKQNVTTDQFNLAVAAYAGHLSRAQDIESKMFNDLGEDVRVVARQSPLPFLQFFTAERIKHNKGLGSGTFAKSAQPGSATTYSLGVQTGPLFGLSLSVELPVMYTPKEGFGSLSYNPDHNLLDLFQFTGRIGAYSALFLGGGDVITNTMGHMFRGFGNMTGMQMFTDAGVGLIEASQVLRGTNRLIFNTTARINEAAITTLSRTGLGLWGIDALMLHNRLMQHSDYSEDVLRMALSNTDISTLKNNAVFAENVAAARAEIKGLVEGTDEAAIHFRQTARRTTLARAAGRSSHFMVGMLAGAAVAWLGSKAMEFFTRSNTSKDVAEYVATEQEREEAWDKHSKYAAVGAAVGGILNMYRKSLRITEIPSDIAGASGMLKVSADFPFGRGVTELKSNSKGMQKVAYQSAMFLYGVNQRAQKLAAPALEAISKFKLARPMVAVAAYAAFFATQYIRIDSDFGLIKYMDQNIVYDKKTGAPQYDGFGVIYKQNRMHQRAVAAGLTAVYGIPAYFVMRPAENMEQMLKAFARDSLRDIKIDDAQFLAKSVGSHWSDIAGGNRIIYRAAKRLPGFRRWSRDAEMTTIIEQLQIHKGRMAGLDANAAQAFNATAATTADDKIRRLIHYLGEEELEQFVKVHRGLQGGREIKEIGDTAVEAYRQTLTKLQAISEGAVDIGETGAMRIVTGKGKDAVQETVEAASKRVNAEVFDAMKILGKQRVLRRVGIKVAGIFAVAALAKTAGSWFFSQGGPAGGEPGKQSYLDRIFDKARAKGMYGNSSEAGFVDGSLMVMADVLRVFLGRDRIDLTLIDHFNKNAQKLKGEKMINAPVYGTLGEYREAMSNRSAIENLLVIDQTNSYFATLDFGGKTIRAGERGHYTSTYFQLQGAGHDISTAGYSMAAKFIFSQYIGGKGQMARNIDAAVGQFKPTHFTQEGVDTVAMMIRNASAMTHALKKSRKIKRISGETEAMLYGDAITNAIIKARYNEIGHIAQQPITSLFTNMFFEGLDKAKMLGGQEAYVAFLTGVARNDRGYGANNESGVNFMKMFADIMDMGAFGNFFGSSKLHNVIMFNGNRKGHKNKNRRMAQDIAGIWHDTNSLSVSAEERKQAVPELYHWYRDKVINPLSTTGLLTFAPKPVYVFGSIAGATVATAWIVQAAARFMQIKDWEAGDIETRKVWGSTAAEGAYAVEVSVSESSFSTARNHTRKGASTGYSAADEQLKASREAAKNAGLGPAEQQIAPISRVNRPGGKVGVYTMTRKVNNKSFRVTMSSWIDEIIDGNAQTLNDATRNAIMKGTTTYRDHFLNIVEKYGASLKKAHMIIEDGASISLRSAFSGAEKGSAMYQRLMQNLNDKGGNIYQHLNKGGLQAADAIVSTKAVIEDEAMKLFDQYLNNFFKDDTLLETTTIMVSRNGKLVKQEVYVFELMADRITPDGHIKGITGADIPVDQNAIGSAKRLEWYNMVKQSKREWLEKIVKQTIEKEVAGSKVGSLTSRNAIDINRLGRGAAAGEQEIRYIMQQILRNVQSDPMFQQFIDSNGGMLQVETLSKSAAVQKAVHKMAKVGANADDVLTEMVEDALQYSAKAKAPASMMGKVMLASVFNTFSFVTDAIFALDTYSAYARVGEAYSSPFATDVDRALAKRELGASIVSTAIGVGLGYGAFKLIPKMGQGFMKFMQNNGGKAILGALAGSAVLAAGWKNFIKPIMSATGKMISENKVAVAMGEFLSNKGSVIDDMVGNMAMAPVLVTGAIGESMGGEEGRKAGIQFGAHGTGAALGASVMLVSLATMGAAISLPVAGVVIGGAFILGGIAGLINPDFLTDMSVKMLRDIEKVPVLGPFLSAGLIKPYQHSRDKLAHKGFAAMAGSPFTVGYIGNVVNKKWLAALSAHEDYTGSEMTGLLFGKILDTSTTLNPAFRKNMASGLVGSPPPIVDEVHMRELKIRAQTYSDNVVGRYTWNEMVRISDSNQRIKDQVKRTAKWRRQQRDYERFLMMNAALTSDNDVSGTNSASHLNAQKAMAEVTKLMNKAREEQQPTEKETFAGLEITDKNVVRNEPEKEARAAVAAAFGIMTVPATTRYILNLTPVGEDLFAGVKPERSEDEEVQQAIKLALGLTTPPPLEVGMSLAAQNLVDTQSMMTANDSA